MTDLLLPDGAPWGVYSSGLAVAAAAMVAVWLVSLWRSDVGIVDGFWGAVIAGLGWRYRLALGDGGTLGWLALLLATAWGLRLSVHLLRRNWSGPEDFRYRAMREKHGARFPAVSLFTVFLLQALLAWIVSAPLFQAAAAGGTPGVLGWFGAAVALAGLLVEAVADRQLRRFRASDPGEGAVLDRGLWRYSRHPNYFGEFVFWWGMFLLVAGTEGAGWAAASPVLMTVLLLRVSGVTMLEEELRKRPAYRRYVERTNAFFPGPSRDGGAL